MFGKISPFLIIPLLVLAVSYVGLMAYLFFFQHRFVYFPEKTLHSTPSDIGRDYKDVFFLSKDGVSLHGWYVPREEARGTILFFHGNAGNISDRLDIVQKCHSFGFHTFIFDYRGYGKSEGVPSEIGTYRDAEAAWDYLTTQLGETPQRIILFGQSLGGAIAAWLAAEKRPNLFVIEASFTSMADMGTLTYPYLPVRWLSRFHYKTEECMRRIQCPVLVIHSREDQLIPFEQGTRLYEAAHEPKRFVPISGDHATGFLKTGPRYDQEVLSFIEKYF